MSEFLMTTWDGAGNTPPMMSVARALVDRGHGVRVMADPTLRDDVLAAGAAFVPWATAPVRTSPGRDGDHIRDWEPEHRLAQLANLRDRVTAGPAAAYAADVLAELDRARADVVLTEVLLLGPLVAAEAAGVPCVVLNPTINMAPLPGVPPFGRGLAPAVTDEDRAAHAAAAAQGLAVWDEALPALNAARAEHGLPALEHVLDQLRSAALVLIMTSEAFDFTGPVPPVIRWVGPRLDDAAWVEPCTLPAGDEPLVLVSLSSDFQDQLDVLRRVVEAVGALDVRVVLTTGVGIDPAEVPAPANVTVLRSAPHRAIMREAAAVVTHCGHGTTIKALAAGVPLVCIPMGRDQFDVAVRAVHTGAAVQVALSAAPEEIADAIRVVLSDARYRDAARRVSARIAEETADDRAVEAIEGLLAVTAAR